MYPLNDKDLDRLSRDAAEHYDVESSTSGWERLESRLDQELPVKEKHRRRFLFWLFFIALISGGSLVYMLGRSPSIDNLRAAQQPELGKLGKVPASSAGSAADKAAETTTAIPQEKNVLPGSEVDGKDEPATDIKSKTMDAATTDNKVAADDKAVTPAGKNAVSIRNKAHKTKVNDQPRSLNNQRGRKNQPLIGSSNDRLPKTENPSNRNSISPTNDKLQKDNAAKLTADDDRLKTTMPLIVADDSYTSPDDGSITKQAQALASIPVAPESTPKPEVKKQESRPSKWEFGLLTGPDFSNVGFKHNSKTGINIGAIVGYRFSDRWLVNTGIIYTKKFYKVEGEDFNPPKHSWLSYQDVQMVTGSCNMFEIPVNIRYDISFNKKGRFFASTGLSSYIMDKQDYDCSYIDDNGDLQKYPWSEDSNYNYFISNLNFSIGYERAIGKRFSIQAEPYFKLPLKGLGYGSIDMNSYGIFITFKYKPVARAKK